MPRGRHELEPTELVECRRGRHRCTFLMTSDNTVVNAALPLPGRGRDLPRRDPLGALVGGGRTRRPGNVPLGHVLRDHHGGRRECGRTSLPALRMRLSHESAPCPVPVRQPLLILLRLGTGSRSCRRRELRKAQPGDLMGNRVAAREPHGPVRAVRVSSRASIPRGTRSRRAPRGNHLPQRERRFHQSSRKPVPEGAKVPAEKGELTALELSVTRTRFV